MRMTMMRMIIMMLMPVIIMAMVAKWLTIS